MVEFDEQSYSSPARHEVQVLYVEELVPSDLVQQKLDHVFSSS
jgi:hypothetical protein